MKVVVIFILFCSIARISGRLRAIPEERFENCDDSPSEGFHRLTNITDSYVEFDLKENGKVDINANFSYRVPVEETLFIRIRGHQYVMGTWQLRFTHTITDACKNFFDPVDIVYPYTKDFPRCPWDKDVSYSIFLNQFYTW